MTPSIPLDAATFDSLLRPTHAGQLAATGVDLGHAQMVYEVLLSAPCVDRFRAWIEMVDVLFERCPEPVMVEAAVRQQQKPKRHFQFVRDMVKVRGR